MQVHLIYLLKVLPNYITSMDYRETSLEFSNYLFTALPKILQFESTLFVYQ